VEYCSQFHQYFTTSFFVPIFFCKKLQSQTFIGGKLGKTILYKKAASKMLVKLTPASPLRQTDVASALSCPFAGGDDNPEIK